MYRTAIPAVMCRALALALPLALSIAGVSEAIAAGARATVSPAAERAASELLSESGVELSLEQFVAATLEAGADGARRGAVGAPDAQARVAMITTALGQAFATERLRPILATNVARALEAGDADALLAHHRSSLGRRLQAATRTRRPAADPAGYERFVARLGSRAGDAERLALLGDYVEESGAADLVARFVVETQVTSLHAVLALSGDGAREHFERGVTAAMDALAPIRDALAEQLPPMLAYTYADFSVDELRAMVAVELSAAGRRLTAGVFDGFREVTVAGNADFVARVRAASALAEMQEEI